jgi:MFS family permease
VNVFGDPSERAKAIGIWAAVSGAGIAIGPIVGGALMTTFSWSSVFWINVPLVLAALLMTFHLVPKSWAGRMARLDPVGAVLSIAAITAVTYAVIEAPENGWTSVATLSVLAAGLALGATAGVGTAAFAFGIGPLVQIMLPRLRMPEPVQLRAVPVRQYRET